MPASRPGRRGTCRTIAGATRGKRFGPRGARSDYDTKAAHLLHCWNNLTSAKHAWLQSYVGIYHRLFTHFPDDRAMVESFFRPRKNSTNEEDEILAPGDDVEGEEEDDGEDDGDGMEGTGGAGSTGGADVEDGVEEIAGGDGVVVLSDTEQL